MLLHCEKPAKKIYDNGKHKDLKNYKFKKSGLRIKYHPKTKKAKAYIMPVKMKVPL